MRFVVYGAGAIGGVVAARLRQSGHDVVVIARGAHLAAIAADGLRIDSPLGSDTFHLPAVAHPGDVEWTSGDVVLLCVKSQDTHGALIDLAAAAPTTLPVVCAQNGVGNEPAALRRFEHVYGAVVACPAAHLEPGVVAAYSAPTTGIIDVGVFPAGTDLVARSVARALARSSFSSEAVSDIGRWKHRKLIANLSNVVGAVCVAAAGDGDIGEQLIREGEDVLAAAGIEVASREEDARRRGQWIETGEIGGQPRAGNSSWQSLRRSTGAVETDYLNGEIVMLGRLHGVPTPANVLFQRLANRMAATGAVPGSTPRTVIDQALASG